MFRKAFFLLLPFAILLSACGAKPVPTMAPTQAPAARAQIQTQVVMQVVASTQASASESYPGPGKASPVRTQNAAILLQNPQAASAHMVIKDAQIELLVSNTDLALSKVMQMASDYQGYMISSQTWYDSGYKHATVRLAVPSSTFENVLNLLRPMGVKVLSETASGQDVSAEYADLQSRLTNLQATAGRVRGFLDNAKTVEESLKINQTLSDLEGQIEQVKGQMNYYEGRTAFSTLTVTLTPEFPTPTPTLTATPTLTPTPTPGWSPGKTFTNASNSLKRSSQSMLDVLIWIVVAVGPYALVLVGLVWTVRRVVFRKKIR